MTASKTDTVPGLRVARIWLDLTQEDAARDAGVCSRTYKKWDLGGLTQSADLETLAMQWGISADVLTAEAPAVDYKRLREFVAVNGGIARVEAALRFLARLEAAEGPTVKGPRALLSTPLDMLDGDAIVAAIDAASLARGMSLAEYAVVLKGIAEDISDRAAQLAEEAG